ncbi:MAG: hypothetical protein WCO44_05840 [Bacteroidota bacterium]
MSCSQCTVKGSAGASADYPCPCDRFIFPLPLNIGAGLDKLPRQTATFPEFRRAMLRDIMGETVEVIDNTNTLVAVKPLTSWRARKKDDPGIMLLEMWAYVCDCLSFYDEVLANEAYIRTCALKPDLRRLVALLGYLPRPAVGSVVDLAAIAEGRIRVNLPLGTAFRSGAFDGNPPQVFELDQDLFIHPFTNRAGITAPHPGKIRQDHPASLLVNLKGEVSEDALLLLVDKADDSQNSCLQVQKVEKYTGADNKQYNRISFTSPTNLRQDEPLEQLQLMKPALTTGLWTKSDAGKTISGTTIILNSLNHQIKPGDFIMLTCKTLKRWFRVTGVNDVSRPINASNSVTVNKNVFTLSGFENPVTALTLHEEVYDWRLILPSWVTDWSNADPAGITVHYNLQTIATITDEPNPTLSASDPLNFSTRLEMPIEKYNPSRFLLQDKNMQGISIGGGIDYDRQKLVPDNTDPWKRPATLPVDVYGNVITASRGETVKNEKLGSGDASVPSQTFKLKKKPLTYYLSPTAGNDQGVKSSLTIYADGIKWSEVNTFYGMKEYDRVYIVRQNDQGESLVTFGDGIRGQRLPTGIDNVVCNYRFGAEAAVPPAGSVNQVSKPVKGLQSVKNILPAYGGSDAEEAGTMRTFAPKSALILDRIVSINDMEAVAAAFPGVRAVQTEWRWDILKQRATAHIYYIGSDSLKTPLSQRIRNLSDPSTPITVDTAKAVPLSMALNVGIDPLFLEQEVIRELFQSLLDPAGGLLAPENIGIGKPLYRSRIFESALRVSGTTAMHEIVVNTGSFKGFAMTPGAGNYFDIEMGGLVINGKQNG